MLIGAWGFDEAGLTAIDSSGNGNNFALTSGTTRGAGHGTTNRGLIPSGTTGATLPNIGLTDVRTTMMWLKGTLLDGYMLEQHVVGPNTAAWGIRYDSASGHIIVRAHNGATFNEAAAPWPDTTTWHHVTGTYDGGTICLYLDGVLADSATLTGPLRVDSAPPTLFGWNSSGAAFADDLRMYDSLLDPTSIGVAAATPVMAANFATAAEHAVNVDFIARVTAAMERFAVTEGLAILAAGAATGEIKARLALVTAALRSPASYAQEFAWALASDSSVDLTIDDDTITAKIALVWSLIAGVTL